MRTHTRLKCGTKRGVLLGKAAQISRRLVIAVVFVLDFACGGAVKQAAPPAPVASFACGGGVTQVAPTSPGNNTGGRDPLTWPFPQSSIWNQPIGTGAAYVDAGFTPAANISADDDWWIVTSSSDPVTNVYNPNSWTHRCGGTAWNSTTAFPSALLVPDAQPPDTPNYASAILQPDGRTIQQYEPTARCAAGGPLFGYQAPTVDIYGDGDLRRALRLRTFQHRRHHPRRGIETLRRGHPSCPEARGVGAEVLLLFFQPAGFPLAREKADDYAASQYHGTNPALTEGSLLAIPASVNISSLGLATDAGRKIAQALQDYGGYIVDDTAWDDFAIATEINPTSSVRAQFLADYGYHIDDGGTPFFNDVNTIFGALKVVDNNGPNSIGGGGTPLVPLAPPCSSLTAPPAVRLISSGDRVSERERVPGRCEKISRLSS